MIEKDRQVEILKKKSTAERLKIAFDLLDFARRRIGSEIHRLNPQMTPSEINQSINQRFLK
jgi:hypothetical protein